MAAGGSRAIRRGHGRALDGKTCGAALIEQNGASRTAGSGLGQRGARARAGAGADVREARSRIGTTDSKAPPGEPEHHAQQRLPRWPGKTAERPAAGGTQHGTWPRPRTDRAKQLETDSSASLRGDTAQENGGHGAGRQCVSIKSPAGVPDDRSVGNVLTEERGKVRTTVREFGPPCLVCVQSETACWACGEQTRAGKPSNLNPVSREIISDSVELCETAVCFLHIQLLGTNV